MLFKLLGVSKVLYLGFFSTFQISKIITLQQLDYADGENTKNV